MNKKLIVLAGALAFMGLTAVYAAAQAPEPGEGVPEENEAWQKEAVPPEMGEEMGAHKEVYIRKNAMQGKRFGGEGAMRGKRFGGEGAMRGRRFSDGEDGFFDEELVLGTIKKHDPKFAQTLEDLRETAAAEYKMTLVMARKLLVMAKKENDEKIEAAAVRELSLEYDTKKLSRKYEHAADADKAAIKTELKGKLSEQFDLRLRGHEIRVQRMEKELAKLKKNIETRKANKDKIVQERVAQLTGEGFGW
ncbi:MAG: hypothetical protein HY796_02165 [Elusimicrobia bacterium]|nr:hypothetical protein [Elusimicrobiota bacterium]